MTVSLVFFGPVVTPRDQCSGDRPERSSTRKKLLQHGSADTESSTENLSLRYMAQILVCDFVRHDTAQFFVICSPQQAGGYDELAAARIGGIYFIVAGNRDLHIIAPARMIHSL